MTNTNYDSDFCGSVPIHVINLIQPYGVLVVFERNTNVILQISENASKIFGKTFQEMIGTALDEYLSPECLKVISERALSSYAASKIPLVWQVNEKDYLTLMHYQEKYIVAEINLDVYDEKKQQTFVSVYQEIKIAMSLIQSAKTIEELAGYCATELKRISGFDKVMVYQFDPDWNGTVIAETLEDRMESYMGVTFPASDVPQQARLLYKKNPFRLIPTRDYQPVKLYPVINPLTHSFIDLSDCNLRAVAAVHLEYLKNMNVMASMSTRILDGNKLWGLIACHHRTPKHLSFEMCSVFELLSDIMSARIATIQNSDFHTFDLKLKEQYKNLIEEAFREGDLQQSLLNSVPDILGLFNAHGAVISHQGRIHTKGSVPHKERIKEFLLWLHSKQLKQSYHTDKLPFEYDAANDFKDVASGVLVIPIDCDKDEYVLLFRPELVRVVNWGGNPEQRIQFDKDEKSYHPRNSFKKWQQLVEGTSSPWRMEELIAAENLRSFIFEFSD